MGLSEFSKGRPRNGQWCKFRMRKPEDAEKLKGWGAMVTPDGFFVGIFAPAQRTIETTVTKADGTVVTSGGVDLPDRVVLQRGHGTNVAAVYHDPASGANEMRDVFFRPDDPDIDGLHPLTDKGHLPPGYVARTFAGEHAHLYRDPLP